MSSTRFGTTAFRNDSSNYSGGRYGVRPPATSWLNPRVLLAIGLVLFTVVRFLSATSVNPVTGKKDRVGMSVDQEIQLGLQSAPTMIQQFGGLAADPRDQYVVDQVGQELVAALERRLKRSGIGQNPYQFEFHLLGDADTVNAFALPGGQVFITQGLFRHLETPGQLAGVLGHEMGHVIERHGAQRMAKDNLLQGLLGALTVASGSMNQTQIAAMVGNMIAMKYGRDDELESDAWGVDLCILADYDPRNMIAVMDVLEREAGGGKSLEILSSHPNPGNRRDKIMLMIRQQFPNGLPEMRDPYSRE